MITNTLNLPQPFVDAATSNHQYRPRRYSVTEVLGGPCMAVLKRRHDHEVTEDVSDRVWAILGTAVHKVLESAQSGPKQHQEHHMCVPVDVGGKTYQLSGICDIYDEESGTVTDWKVTSAWKAVVGDFDDWRTQTLLYCWMLRKMGRRADRGQIVAILRDHNKRKAAMEPDYPQHHVMELSWDFTDEDMIDAEVMVRRWFYGVEEAEQAPDDELWPCTEEKRWHKPDTWAVMKDGRKRAVRVFEDEEEAVELLNALKEKDKGHHIEFREGEDTRCMSYCSVAQWCPYGRKFFQDSEDSQAPSV